MYEQNQPSLLGLFRTVIFFVLIAGYGMISLSTEDPLWFVPTFSEQAAEVSIFCRGREEVVSGGSAHLAALNEYLNGALSGRKNWDSLTMSESTYAYYQDSDAVVVLEFRYRSPVRVHSIYKYFSGVDTIVVPLVGRHSGVRAVFGMVDGLPTAGALHIQSNAEMLDYVVGNGLCSG